LCAKSVIIHTSVTYKLIKTGMSVNCNVRNRSDGDVSSHTKLDYRKNLLMLEYALCLIQKE